MPINPFDQPSTITPDTSDSNVIPLDPTKEQAQSPDPKIKKRNEEFRTRIASCKTYRRRLISNWATNIDYRRGKPFTSQTDDDQISVNLDWSLTKAKQASLFSQIPQVRVGHGEDLLPGQTPWVLPFQKKLNDTLVDSGIEAAMDECLPDCINASGLGVVLVSYEALTEQADVPSMDLSSLPPEVGMQVLQSGTLNGEQIPMETIDRPVDHRYIVQRLSPADFLWPINFTGSNFDNAPWVGRTGRMTWTEAMNQFGLTEEDRQSVLSEDKTIMDRLSHDVERDKTQADDMVGFDEVFYYDYRFDEASKNYRTIRRLVFVVGKDEPVIDEPWKGQKLGDSDQLIGAQRYPIRVLTLTYITDETIPPSDSAIGRPQVNEINKGRTQMIHQRERSLPVRWFDVNRIDPALQQGLMRGTWQNMIPVQGDGQRVLGEVARAQMPSENFHFDQIAKNDLNEEWILGSNQVGSGGGVETKGESDNIQSNVALPRVRERARVASFVAGIAEILGGLICLYEDPSVFGQGFDPAFSKTLKYSILADSTVILDSTQKLNRLNQFVNIYGKSGWVNLEPVLQEIAQLSGLDPTVVIKAPMPKPPVEPNISLRLTGVEDLLNPLSLAMLIKSGQAPPAAMIEQAKALIQQAVTPPQGLQMPGSPLPLGGLPMLPQGAAPTVPPGAPIPPPVPGPPPGTQPPLPQPPPVGEANPRMSAMPTIVKRSEPGGRQ